MTIISGISGANTSNFTQLTKDYTAKYPASKPKNNVANKKTLQYKDSITTKLLPSQHESYLIKTNKPSTAVINYNTATIRSNSKIKQAPTIADTLKAILTERQRQNYQKQQQILINYSTAAHKQQQYFLTTNRQTANRLAYQQEKISQLQDRLQYKMQHKIAKQKHYRELTLVTNEIINCPQGLTNNCIERKLKSLYFLKKNQQYNHNVDINT